MFARATRAVLTISILIFHATISHSYTLDEWADAIFRAEGGKSATYLYGIRSISYKDEAEARRICKNTVYKTLVTHRDQRCKSGDTDMQCLAKRYCPVGSDTDNGTCKYWAKNVKHFLGGQP